MKAETKNRITNYYDKRSPYKAIITLCLSIKHNKYTISKDILKIIYNILCQQIKFVNITQLKPKTRHITMVRALEYVGLENIQIIRIRIAHARHRNPGFGYRYRLKLFVTGFSNNFLNWIKDIERRCEFSLGKKLKPLYNQKHKAINFNMVIGGRGCDINGYSIRLESTEGINNKFQDVEKLSLDDYENRIHVIKLLEKYSSTQYTPGKFRVTCVVRKPCSDKYKLNLIFNFRTNKNNENRI